MLTYFLQTFFPLHSQVNAEFRRLTSMHLQHVFFLNLDKSLDRMVAIMRLKGGAQGAKIRSALKFLEQAPVSF